MPVETYLLEIPAPMTRPGYWLYVWSVITDKGAEILYVGRTGDKNYATAGPPIVRMGQHFDPNSRARSLLDNLITNGVNPDCCMDFRIVAHGPLFPPPNGDKAYHDPRIAVVSPLERALSDALEHNGYVVMGQHDKPDNLCRRCWEDVRQAFVPYFGLTLEYPGHNQGPDHPCFQHA